MRINSEKQKAPTNMQRGKVQNQSHDLVSNPDSTESTSKSLNLSQPVSSLKTMGIIKTNLPEVFHQIIRIKQ